MIRIIFDNGGIADCKNVSKIIFDKEELVKEVRMTRNPKEDTYIFELKEVKNERSFN